MDSTSTPLRLRDGRQPHQGRYLPTEGNPYLQAIDGKEFSYFRPLGCLCVSLLRQIVSKYVPRHQHTVICSGIPGPGSTMTSERDPSISTLFALCIREFHTLLDIIPDEQTETRLKVQDDIGRLRVWVGNFGAYRKQADRLSLDHRLREAPELHCEVRNHINDIREAIQGGI